MNIRFIQSGCLDGYTNMAVDEALLMSCSSNGAPATLRLYGWRPPAISIGYFQEAGDIYQGARPDMTPDIVRRLTGGGAILHDRELTYCLVAGTRRAMVPAGFLASYEVICAAVIRGLRGLGIDSHIRGRDGSGSADAGPQSFFCFDRHSEYDITFKGRKLVGSAQRRKKNVLLQHGSILLEGKSTENTTSVSSILGRPVGLDEASRHIAEGFRQELCAELTPGSLTEHEEALVRHLLQVKYSKKGTAPFSHGTVPVVVARNTSLRSVQAAVTKQSRERE